uniref:Uncharacterized protein n=1 Tax=Oryza brachyantha TaxID=4533 RepID=J3MAC3_ORYBR
MAAHGRCPGEEGSSARSGGRTDGSQPQAPAASRCVALPCLADPAAARWKVVRYAAVAGEERRDLGIGSGGPCLAWGAEEEVVVVVVGPSCQ